MHFICLLTHLSYTVLYHCLSNPTLIPIFCDISRTVRRRSPSIISSTNDDSAALIFGFRPILGSSSTDYRPSRNNLCHLKTKELRTRGLCLDSSNIFIVSIGVLLKFAQNLMTARISVYSDVDILRAFPADACY